MPSKKKGSQASQTQKQGQRFQRPWELGDPTWESIPATVPEYHPWKKSCSKELLEVTLDDLRQGELWLSGSLRLLAESVNEDCHARDELVYQTREQASALKMHLERLEAEVRAATVAIQEQGKAITHLSDQQGAIMSRLTALESRTGAAAPTADIAAAELRQDISDQLLRMAAVIGCRTGHADVIATAASIEERIRAAQEVARVMRSPLARSVAESRASSPAPSLRRGC